MSAEGPRATGPAPPAVGTREPPEPVRRAWDLALGRARERAAQEATAPCPSLAGLEGHSGTVGAFAPLAPGAEGGGEVGAAGLVDRAAVAVAVLAQGDRLRLEVSAGPGLRFALAEGAGGVEIRVRAAPPLERLARADLHAVAFALRCRGVRVARATVSLAAPATGGVCGRVDLTPRGR